MVSAKQQCRLHFIKLVYQGYSCSLIYREMIKKGHPLSLSTVKSWRRRVLGNPHEFLSGKRRGARGNPRAHRKGLPPLSREDKLRIRACIRANPEQDMRTTAAHLPEGIQASKSTVHRQKKLAGLRFRHPQPKPKLSRKQRKARREFARANLGREWALVVFTER